MAHHFPSRHYVRDKMRSGELDDFDDILDESLRSYEAPPHNRYLLDEGEDGQDALPHYPLKSTLPTNYRHVSARTAGSQASQQTGARNFRFVEPTMSTEMESAAPSADGGDRPAWAHARDVAAPPLDDDEDDGNFIPEVGRGQLRPARGSAASTYSAHRDLLAMSDQFAHPSPSTAQRHDHMRAQAHAPHMADSRPRRLSPIHAGQSDDDDSESDVTLSSDGTSIMGATAPFRSAAESTGNHHGLIASPEPRAGPQARRPRLAPRALDELDHVTRKGTVSNEG